jgi:hypothetical protein
LKGAESLKKQAKDVFIMSENKRYKKSDGEEIPDRSRSRSFDAKVKDVNYYSINLKQLKQNDEKFRNTVQGKIIKISDWAFEDKFEDDGSFTPEMTNALRRKVADLRS